MLRAAWGGLWGETFLWVKYFLVQTGEQSQLTGRAWGKQQSENQQTAPVTAALISRNTINTHPDATPCQRANQQEKATLPKCKALPQVLSAACSSDACRVREVTAEPSLSVVFNSVI